jgi:hypothetical protein
LLERIEQNLVELWVLCRLDETYFNIAIVTDLEMRNDNGIEGAFSTKSTGIVGIGA